MSEDFSRALRERVDALQPRIDVDTSHVISGARRRRTLRRSAVTTVVLTAVVVLVVALSAQPWTSWTSTPPAATPTVPTELVAPEGTYWHTRLGDRDRRGRHRPDGAVDSADWRRADRARR